MGVESREISGKSSWGLRGSAARPEHVSAARSMQSQAQEARLVRCGTTKTVHFSTHAGWPAMMKTLIGPAWTGSGSGFIDESATPKQVSMSSAMVVRLRGRWG